MALLCLALPMFASYFFDDIFSTINQEFEDPSMVALGWSMADYGFYRSAYSLLCIFGGLIICGMLLDRWGVRLTGSIFVGLMVGGAALITYAISESFAGSRLCAWLSGVFAKPSLSLAYAGCAMFGLGSEIAGVTVNRAIAKWFKGREIALAMGLQLALARLGTAVALIVVPRIVELEGYIPFSETSKPAVVGMMLLLGALVLWGLFVAMDYGADRRGAAAGSASGASDTGSSAEDRFRFRDVLKVITDRHFILISLLCVFFYCCVVSFRKFATAILMPGVRAPVRSRRGPGGTRYEDHDTRVGHDSVLPPDRCLCPGCAGLWFYRYRSARPGLLPRPGSHVAFASEDYRREPVRSPSR